MGNKSITNLFKGDITIWMIFFFLCMISIVEVYSASSSLSYKGGNYWAPIMKHVGLLFLGFIAMLVTLNIKCKYFKIMTPFLILFSLFFLILVLFTGESTNGASRWISVFGIQFQPSEIAKGTAVLTVAQVLSALQTDNGASPRACKYVVIIGIIFGAFIMVENFSTAALLATTLFFMMVIGRVPWKQLLKLTGVCAALIALFLCFVMLVGTDKSNEPEHEKAKTEQSVKDSEPKEEPGKIAKVFHRFDTWKSRIIKFTGSKQEIKPEDVDLDKDAQVAYANIAIASSEFIGKGPGNSVERDFLSQAFSDFIYAIIIEEMGIWGAAFVAFLYIALLFRTGKIASKCENNFPAFLAMGLAIMLVTQALFNMMVAVGLAPVTGQPLPLISKGGTSTIINCVYVGAILSISRSAKKKTQTT